ncbi:hypothetical protein [Paenibacillus aceris]|uniref:Uncharacterized membrane protein YcgQ (UPF0703/DUF1980 family) n=1 Tax=Paenibacillus aceris TaxID=869555 RepID=A0ABS4I8B6_9BACL|nr:hypothetical protein [Paenibacillus aceris]MBP1967180.1 uncharacterized membrane protein YcgQ (UPF0703/DUF1980 family) [Paenibacillus aceris]NHW35576.1 hypothetical protein [Paenibacillus aceris]
MRRYIKYAIIIGVVLMISTGCGKEVIGDEKTAEQYVELHGNKVTSRNGEVQKYVLDKSNLESTQYQQIWGVQKEEPDKYFGKEITVYGFTVKQHPLEKIYNTETNVSVIVCEGKVR